MICSTQTIIFAENCLSPATLFDDKKPLYLTTDEVKQKLLQNLRSLNKLYSELYNTYININTLSKKNDLNIIRNTYFPQLLKIVDDFRPVIDSFKLIPQFMGFNEFDMKEEKNTISMIINNFKSI